MGVFSFKDEEKIREQEEKVKKTYKAISKPLEGQAEIEFEQQTKKEPQV